ncbi:Ankyrin repeat-containing domain [Phytophthora cactorum]|nr:Ankyrin repeat-containing domain [Phytophthora cactorum]
MLKHLEEKRKSYPITCPIVEAAAAGWLDEIERLHCNASAYKIKVAMAEAARHNQVEVVKYKTYNTRLAVKTADAVGQTEVLVHLLWNKPEDLVIAVLESVARHGRVDILKSFENDSDYETDKDYEDRRYERIEGLYRASDVLGEAARAGHREAVRWILDAARVESKTIHVIERAVRDGRHDVVVLLCSCCTKEERYLTLYRGISLRSNLDAIKAIYDAC